VHPAIDAWPGNERWFDNRCSPMNSEFTIHQIQDRESGLQFKAEMPAGTAPTTRDGIEKY
jgi:hypothetical protein